MRAAYYFSYNSNDKRFKSKVNIPLSNTAIAFNENMVSVQKDTQYFSKQRSSESY